MALAQALPALQMLQAREEAGRERSRAEQLAQVTRLDLLCT